MLYTVLKENSYQDSINLMLLTNHISTLDGVDKVQVMMGTDANKDIFNSAGLLSKEAEGAKPSDMVIVIDTEDESLVGDVMKSIDKFLSDLSVKKGTDIQVYLPAGKDFFFVKQKKSGEFGYAMKELNTVRRR